MAQAKQKTRRKAVKKKAAPRRPARASTRKIIWRKPGPSVVPLSDGVAVGNLLFVSGTTPFDDEGRIARGDFGAQMHQIMSNIKAILAVAGSSLDLVVKTVIILTRIDDFRQMNEIYRQYFKEGNYPARTTLAASLAHPDFLLEIECVAEISPAV